MQLSLAVNNSLVALSKFYIFCTEPFRIPFAGRIDVACFDKTGTLTAENLIVEGISGIHGFKNTLCEPKKAPKETTRVLAAAHALAMLEDGIIGDPMEKNTLESIEWTLDKKDIISSKSHAGVTIKILRRFQFSSQLKRMSTVSLLSEKNENRILVSVKGAPETLKEMFSKVPAGYDDDYKYWARRGKRVLALGYKHLPSADKSMVSLNCIYFKVNEMHRDEAESNLTFAGFLVFFCPLKPDAKEAVSMLNNSSHRVVMITGDNALTACHVAKEVEISERPILIADVRESKGILNLLIF
jgi:cation-transporting ATPase 13A1